MYNMKMKNNNLTNSSLTSSSLTKLNFNKMFLMVAVMAIMFFTVACPNNRIVIPEPEPAASDVRFDQPENIDKNFYYIFVNYYNNKINTIQLNFRTDLSNFNPYTKATIVDWRYEIMNGDQVLLEVNMNNYTEIFDFNWNPGSETRDMIYDIAPSLGRIRFNTDKTKYNIDPFKNKSPKIIRITIAIEDDYGASYNISKSINVTEYILTGQ